MTPNTDTKPRQRRKGSIIKPRPPRGFILPLEQATEPLTRIDLIVGHVGLGGLLYAIDNGAVVYAAASDLFFADASTISLIVEIRPTEPEAA